MHLCAYACVSASHYACVVVYVSVCVNSAGSSNYFMLHLIWITQDSTILNTYNCCRREHLQIICIKN